MKTALGKGLQALLPEKGNEISDIEIGKIIPSDSQPRKMFKDDSLKELSISIKEKGILQPIIVSKQQDGTYKIVAGERRWKAAKLAGLNTIPALIKEVSSQTALEIALIENIQREELNPIETAEALQRLHTEFNLTQEELSQKVGKDRSTIANYLRILKLPEEIKNLINHNLISLGHAKVLLSLTEKEKQIQAAEKILKYNLSVRATETLCKKLSKSSNTEENTSKIANLSDIEKKFESLLGTKVKIRYKGGKGAIEIKFKSSSELERFFAIFSSVHNDRKISN
ncbi:MAG: ParB/RepB/Spo0J family partition protein [Thermodesulfovibrionales bacterium]|nr:ParB/RepB/Spo0J family partition protein [Thermodesulfovibrionales bacterium]